MIVRIRGVNKTRGRNGVFYYYHRNSGTRLPGAPGSPEFTAALERLNAGEAVKQRKVPGSIGELIEAYRSSPEWTSRAPRTQQDYQKIFNYLGKLDGVALSRFTTEFLYKLRDKAAIDHKRRFANYTVQVLRLLFNWGVRRGRLTANPAVAVEQVPRARGAKTANRPWTATELQTVLDAAPVELRVGVALAAYVGMDTPDLVAAEWSSYVSARGEQAGRISYNRRKTGVLAEVRVHRQLAAVLDEARTRRRPDVALIVVGERLRPLTVDGFRANFFKLIQRLEAEGRIGPDLTIKGLRHTLGTHLAEAGCDPPTIAAVLGQKTTAMAEHYSRRARRGRLADAAIERLEGITHESKEENV